MLGLPEQRPARLDSRLAPGFIKYMSRAQVAGFKATNGRLGSKWRVGAGWKKPVPVLLLEHVGRKSGKRFETPLLYMEDAPNLVVVASQGGLPRNPQWYANLGAHRDVHVRLKGEGRRAVRARTATPDEREALWPRLIEVYADFEKYQKWTERTIPVVVLERR